VAAAEHPLLGRIEPSLPAGDRGIRRRAVLGDVDGAAGPEHPGDLLQGGVSIGDGAQREGDENGVDGAVGKIEPLTVEAGPRDRSCAFGTMLGRDVSGPVGRLDGQDARNGLRIQRTVQTRPEAQFQDSAVEPGAGPLTERLNVLGSAGDIDDVREQPISPDTHGGQRTGAGSQPGLGYGTRYSTGAPS